MVHIGNDWDKVLEGEFQQEYYQELRKILVREYRSKRIFPPAEKIFNALKWTSYADCKVVLLGQDPYHGLGQAHGLSFSVPKGQRIPPSLQNMYKELQDSLGLRVPHHGCLEKWAGQGVLLLNTSLTVVEGQASSHSNILSINLLIGNSPFFHFNLQFANQFLVFQVFSIFHLLDENVHNRKNHDSLIKG